MNRSRTPIPGNLATANLALSFLLELCVLVSVTYWGVFAHTVPLEKILLGLFLPVVIAILWGIFAAPQSLRRLTGVPLVAFTLVIFGLAAAALFLAGQTILALIFAVVSVINRGFVLLDKQ